MKYLWDPKCKKFSINCLTAAEEKHKRLVLPTKMLSECDKTNGEVHYPSERRTGFPRIRK